MYRTITYLLRTVFDAVSSARTFADQIGHAFVEQASPVLKGGETLPASFIAFLITVVARLMERARDKLKAAEKAHRLELRKQRRLRKRRDQEAEELYTTLLKVRTTSDGAHGKGTAELYLGLDPGFGNSEPQVLLRYGQEARDVLSDPGFQLPDTALKSTSWSPSEYVAEIKPPLEKLETTFEELGTQNRLTQEALKVKERALKSSRRVIIHGSRLLESLYFLAGEEYHAARLRGKVRSPAGSEDETSPPPEVEEPAATEGESTSTEGESAAPPPTVF